MRVFCEGMLIIEEVAKTEDAKDNTDNGNANLEDEVQNPEAKAEKEECEHGCRSYRFTAQRYGIILTLSICFSPTGPKSRASHLCPA